MIPSYGSGQFLDQTIQSVIDSSNQFNNKEIVVVENPSEFKVISRLVKKYKANSVQYILNETNLGIAGNWNKCIELAKHEYVHILHDDDWVLPGFYQTIQKNAERYPEASLIATRSFGVDQRGIIEWITPRLRNLENCEKDAHDFYYQNPIQCPGVVVKRKFYENHGGFRLDMDYVLDHEMWVRTVSMSGGVITPDILACYRTHDENGTSRLMRTAENLYSIHRLNQLFAERYLTFDYDRALIQLLDRAHRQAEEFSRAGDNQAAQLSFDFWREHALKKKPLRRFFGKIKRSIFS